jgi:hypothetical protein
MGRILLIVALALSSIYGLTGCEIETEVEEKGPLDLFNDPEPFDPQFENQDLLGQINGVDWSYVYGTAKSRENGEKFFIELSPVQPEQPCRLVSGEDKLMFSVSAEEGEHELAFGKGTVTMVEFREEQSPMNHILARGVIDLIQIGDEEIRGRMDVGSTEKTWANGNFVVTICD